MPDLHAARAQKAGAPNGDVIDDHYLRNNSTMHFGTTQIIPEHPHWHQVGATGVALSKPANPGAR